MCGDFLTAASNRNPGVKQYKHVSALHRICGILVCVFRKSPHGCVIDCVKKDYTISEGLVRNATPRLSSPLARRRMNGRD